MLWRASAAVVLAAFAAKAQTADTEPYPLKLRVGGSVAVCKTGAILCPANNPACDDTSVVTASIDEAQGLVFKGLKPGTTLCSAAVGSGLGQRRVFRVTVTP
ncbi:MAG TPA: hypothetical protein VMK66_21580 [Myxococcales bacterium]|nr:hypothetical protein [Myxococcales bacterium]